MHWREEIEFYIDFEEEKNLEKNKQIYTCKKSNKY